MSGNALILRFVLVAGLLAPAMCPADDAPDLKDANVLIIRHAEKPESGDGLTPAGEARAKKYAAYFKNFQTKSGSVKVDAIFAAADSRGSRRPRLTVEPLAQALALTVNTSYKDKEYQLLAEEIHAHHAGQNILICWHHGAMPELLRVLGADPSTLLPGGNWPDDEYAWVIQLRYDAIGRLKEAQRLVEPF